MKRRKKQQNDPGAPKWMVTFSDMVTLILVFFILLFSMSQIDLAKFESITESFQSRAILDFMPSAIPSEDISDPDTIDLLDEDKDGEGKDDDDFDKLSEHLEEWEKKADALAQLIESVEEYLEEEGLEGQITANRTEEGVILVLQDSIFFDSAEAEILETGEPFLDEVGSLLKGISNHVRVEGHTDTSPISTYRYSSNWELYGARDISVVRYFIEEHDLDEARFIIGGYGDTRPLTTDNHEDGWTQNRRVEIVILDSEHEQTK